MEEQKQDSNHNEEQKGVFITSQKESHAFQKQPTRSATLRAQRQQSLLAQQQQQTEEQKLQFRQKAIRKIRNKFSTEKVMMMLDKEKLEALEEEFAEHPEGLELDNFVWLMKSAMNHKPEEEYDLVHGLCKLFNEVDINGDQHMEWKEFTQYIIDAVMQNQVALDSKNNEREGTKKIAGQQASGATGNGDKDGNGVDQDNSSSNTNLRKQQEEDMDLLEQAESFKLPRFYQSKNVDKAVHLGYIIKAIYCERFDVLLTVENMQKELKLYTPECKVRAKLEPSFKREAFILSASYDEEKAVFGCVSSDSCMYFWESHHTQLSLKFVKSLNAPCIQTGIWFLPKHKTWITAGKDNVVREWDIWMGFTADCLLASFNDHEEDVMDVCEIHSPLAIATASFDRTIRIYNLQDKTAIGILKEHKTGVRSLNYSPFHGGNILSVGHENYINVWSPEGSISRSHIGKLEGHNVPVVCAKFINQTPFCVSVDEKLNIRIWDIRTLQCQQIIGYESKSKLPLHGLLIFPQTKKFAVLSKRFIFYDTINTEDQSTTSATTNHGSAAPSLHGASSSHKLGGMSGSSLSDILGGLGGSSGGGGAGMSAQQALAMRQQQQISVKDQQTYAIDAHFNHNYLNFNIVTKSEIRTYDGLTGKLVKVFSEVVDERTNADLSAFCLDNRYRKCYLGDASGSIRVFNISNGVFIKHVNNDDDKELRQKRSALLKKGKSKEISCLKFAHFDDYLMLITTGWDSTLKVYDEEDPDETLMLRKSVGGHFKDDISALVFSDYLSIVATGSRSGIVCIWDFETNKLEGICLGQKRAVTMLSFVKEYPLLVSAGACGIVSIWGVRPCPYELRNVCLGRFINLGWDGESFANIGICAGFVRVIEPSEEGDETSHMVDKTGSQNKKEESNDEEEDGELKDSESFIQQAYSIHFNADSNEKVEKFVTEFTKIKEDNDPEEGTIYNHTYANYFQKYMPPASYAEDDSSCGSDSKSKHSNKKRPKCILAFGDEKGFIKQWDLSVFIHHSRNNHIGLNSQSAASPAPYVCKAKSFRANKLSYNPKRKQKIDASNVAPSHLQTAKAQKLPPLLDAKRCVQLKEQKGHKSQINSLREILIHPYGFISTSMDKHVKIWSLYGELWGDIYLLKESYDKNWCFPFNWMSHRNQEVVQIREVLQQIKENNNDIKQEESQEVTVEFDDDLEHQMREQQKKAEQVRMGQTGNFEAVSAGKDLRKIQQQLESRRQKQQSQNQTNQANMGSVPQYYVTATHPLLAKDFGQTEDYKRKIKRMIEGPPKFYTGFVFDLEQDLVAFSQRKTASMHGGKLLGAGSHKRSSMRTTSANRGGANSSSRSKQTAGKQESDQATDAVSQSKFSVVTENLRQKYLAPIESYRSAIKETISVQGFQTERNTINQEEHKSSLPKDTLSSQLGGGGWLTDRKMATNTQNEDKAKHIPISQSKYLSQKTHEAAITKATNNQTMNRDQLAVIPITERAISTPLIPQYALKSTRQISKLSSNNYFSQASQRESYTSGAAAGGGNANQPDQSTAYDKQHALSKQKSETQLLKNLAQNKQKRRMIIGFEASKHSNGNFLKKLDRMIGVSTRPKSLISPHVEDVKYVPGEGIKQITKALESLNNQKYSEIHPHSSSLANRVLLQSRSELRIAVERGTIKNNKRLLDERDKRIKDAENFDHLALEAKQQDI